jgi:hypothetical protein
MRSKPSLENETKSIDKRLFYDTVLYLEEACFLLCKVVRCSIDGCVDARFLAVRGDHKSKPRLVLVE